MRDRPGPVLPDDARCTSSVACEPPHGRILTRGTSVGRPLLFCTMRNLGAKAPKRGHAREVDRTVAAVDRVVAGVAALHLAMLQRCMLQRCILPCCRVAYATGGSSAQVAKARINTLQILPRATGALPRPPRPASSTQSTLGFRTPSWYMCHVGDYPRVVRPPAAVRPTDSVMARSTLCSQYSRSACPPAFRPPSHASAV